MMTDQQKRLIRHGCRAVPSGSTLIELMVAMTISLFLMGGIVLIYMSGRSSSVESEQLSRAQENIRFVSDYLVRELRNAGFRSQDSLTFEQFNTFAGIPAAGSSCSPGACGFAAIRADGQELTIRMSGTSSCAEPFSTKSSGLIVTNRYFIEGGSLMCEGSLLAGGTREVELASGVQQINFSFVCPAGHPDCGVPYCALFPFGSTFTAEEENLSETCQGVRTRIVFAGIAGNDGVDFPVELAASFRNVALGRLKYAAVP